MKVHRMHLGIGLGICALASLSFCQADIYRSVYTLKDLKIKLRPWGSGTIAETDEAAFEGAHSVRITSRNFFQGGIFSLANPIDLSGEMNSSKEVLRIAVHTPITKVITPAGAAGAGAGVGRGGSGAGGRGGGGAGGGGGFGGGGGSDEGALSQPGGVGTGFAFALPSSLGQVGQQGGPPPGAFGGGQMPPGFGFPGQFPPGQFPGAGGPGAQNTTSTVAPMQYLRMIVTTTDGKKSEVYLPVAQSRSDKSGWKSLGIPLKAISGFDKTNKVVKEVAFSADTLATFYIGGVSMVQDVTPIDAQVYSRIRGVKDRFEEIQFANVALNDTVEFRATGYGGSSILAYDWDFDASDGIQVDATGNIVKCTFHKPGTFTITLTARDKYGFKKSVSKTVGITVNP